MTLCCWTGRQVFWRPACDSRNAAPTRPLACPAEDVPVRTSEMGGGGFLSRAWFISSCCVSLWLCWLRIRGHNDDGLNRKLSCVCFHFILCRSIWRKESTLLHTRSQERTFRQIVEVAFKGNYFPMCVIFLILVQLWPWGKFLYISVHDPNVVPNVVYNTAVRAAWYRHGLSSIELSGEQE
jgi:hypothetical protein